MTHKQWWRRFGDCRLPTVLADGGTLPANAVVLPRRSAPLRFAGCATWDEFMAAYAAELARPPAEVLLFARPPAPAHGRHVSKP